MPPDAPTTRRDVLKIGGIGAAFALLGTSAADAALAQQDAPTDIYDDAEQVCVFVGTADPRDDLVTAPDAVTWLYLEYTGDGGPGAWFHSADGDPWQLLHDTTDELRLRNESGDGGDRGIITREGRLWKVSYV